MLVLLSMDENLVLNFKFVRFSCHRILLIYLTNCAKLPIAFYFSAHHMVCVKVFLFWFWSLCVQDSQNESSEKKWSTNLTFPKWEVHSSDSLLFHPWTSEYIFFSQKKNWTIPDYLNVIQLFCFLLLRKQSLKRKKYSFSSYCRLFSIDFFLYLTIDDTPNWGSYFFFYL